jgi:RNA polymerase-binding transcription factor DksA
MKTLTRAQVRELELLLLRRREACLEEAVAERAHEHEQSIADVAGEVPDTGDASVAMLVTDIEHTMAERHVTELHAVDRALAQLHDESFGRCSDCEGEIGYARLKASPTAIRCTACQTVRERTYAHEATPTL